VIDDDKFFEDFNKRTKAMFPSKKKMAVWGIGMLLLNIILFIGAVGVIALAVKWVISQ
jgi:hypothetical protein